MNALLRTAKIGIIDAVKREQIGRTDVNWSVYYKHSQLLAYTWTSSTYQRELSSLFPKVIVLSVTQFGARVTWSLRRGVDL